MKSIFIALAAAFLAVTSGFAEVIHLKDGRVINQKIIERGPHYILTMDGKIPTRHYNDQIDHIEEDAPQNAVGHDAGFEMTKYPDLDEAKVALILTLIDASGVRKNMELNIEQILGNVDEAQRGKFRELFNIKDIIDRIVPVYNRYYTVEDLQAIIAFYQSAPGQKTVEVTPKIMEDTVQETMKYIEEKISPEKTF